MRRFALAWCALAGLASAQSPDVRIKTDIRVNYRSIVNGDSALRWYDTLGRPSLVMVEFELEPGFKAHVAERFQKVRGDADEEQLYEYFVEDPGIWRVGKQMMPFGRNALIRDMGRGARGDTNLLFNRLPLAMAVADNGPGRVRGVYARVGSRLGFSGAIGSGIAAQSGSLTVVRRPEASPGKGRGHRLAVGIDYAQPVGDVRVQAEIVGLRRGQTALDRDTEISDLTLTYDLPKDWGVTVGWSREWRASRDMFRAEGHVEVYKNVFLEPIVRFRGGRMYDAGISLRVKL